MPRARSWVPASWGVVLALLMLGPALGPGFVLTYDMVWVPDLSLRPDFLGLGSGVPRAVPSDAVVAALDEVVPGMLLQKLVLLGALVAGGAGAAGLVPDVGLVARCAAVTVYVWNPWVVERLVIGQWPLLVTYAVLPWLVSSLLRWRAGAGGRGWWLLVVLGSLSASGGLLVLAVLLLVGAGRGLPRRRWAELLAVPVAANAPWVVAGLLHAAEARVDPRSAEVFALSAEGMLPAPLAALSLGGIWNADVVPGSREGLLAVVSLLVLLLVAGVGATRWRRVAAMPRLARLWVLGYAGAVATWLVPTWLGEVAAVVPGAGVMRDGSRLLLLCSPLVAVLVAHGVSAVGSLFVHRWQGVVVAAAIAVAPVPLLPDAAWGAGGRLVPVAYPAAYEAARQAVGDEGDVLVLPFSSYRAFDWNGRRPSLDPLGRYLRPDFVVDDALRVDGRPLAGEDPRATAVARALAGGSPEEDLAALGITAVVVDRTARGDPDEVAGRPVLTGTVEVLVLEGAAEPRTPATWLVALAVGWSLFLAVLSAAIFITLGEMRARIRWRPWGR
ncbi:hypothetical protein [Nocardioides coralli]|uniref:hypothetical protein n=1 Tax=Nocardioides coralli TaxID=2872154 RepID=UPI001CA4591E|nr:hypothetical protein [Nocardioides coralli]QZY27906.1 hypothetical protein K6T13_10365 [Nocardioides coralli]